jgi:WD40 repeat protein/ABC-type phosphate transport system substrate-binding protein
MIGVILTPYASASDGDGDGVNDDVDICPFAAGTANSTAGLGCPDSDGDGIADFEQAITHNWGQAIRENTDYGSSGSGVRGMAWAQNFSYFYAGGGNGGVQLFDAQGNHVSTLHQMAGDINEIALSPDGTMLAVASDDGGCKILNSTTGSLIVELLNTTTNILSIAWAGDSSKVILSTGDIEVQWFHTSNWTHEMTISNLPSWTSGIDSTPDGRLIFFSTNNNLRGYWTNNGTMYLNLTNHTEYIRSVKVSPDGRYVATGSNDNNVKITDIATKTVVTTIWAGSDVYDIDFSPDGGTMVVARGRSSDMYAYQTDTWSSLGSMDGFGSSNNNRGVYSVEFHEDGDKLAVGWRRGYVSIHMAADAYIRVHGLHYTSLMENPWRSTYPTIDESVRVWEYDRVTSTLDVCDSKHYIGSSTNGVSPLYADKAANYSETGLWDCKYTEEQILEIPYGRAAGALMVTSGGNTETCVQTIGGLSMAQVRWIISGSTKSTLTSPGGMPALDWDSVVPNDDGNGIPEWIDLDSTCPDTEIVLSHRWENKTDTTILHETVLCANCAQTDSIYSSTSSRFRAIAGEFRSDVTQGVAASGGEGSIGFTEMVYATNNNNGIYIVPLVDNFTHGAADAIADGAVAINASVNASRSGEWPLQTDMRAFVSLDHISKNLNFLKFLLSDLGQLKWEQMGFTGLDVWGLYTSWAKLGVDKSYLLPDADSDGIWDGDDLCPETELGLSVDLQGCAENQLDDDNDGFTNDLDDCDDVAGTSIYGSIGCPDGDGDGWQDSDDSHPNDNSEWNDTDMDGYGDNSDDCITEFGNSTQDVLGCIDSDGDGWSDSGDDFPEDPLEWKDSDSDGYGDNADAFPFEVTQWLDSDGDGFGDNNTGLEGDDCVNVSGSSNMDGLFGCIDSDGDGWADSIDDLPSNPEQYRDVDGDGVGDSAVSGYYDLCIDTSADEIAMVDSNGCGPSQRDVDYDSFNDDVDQCPNTPLLQSTMVNTTLYLDDENTVPNPFVGCAPSEIDADGDLVTSDLDWDDNNPYQWADTDGDGYGDNSDEQGGDDCPTQKGTSIYDQVGCFDLDGDGWSFDHDFNDGDATQWNDTDGDGFGDNWDNPEWNESRIYGEFVVGATQPDRCPNEYSVFLYSDTQGCLSSLEVAEEDEQKSSQDSEEDDSNFVLILGIAGVGIVLILFGAIAVLIRKKPKSRVKSDKAVHPALEPATETEVDAESIESAEEVMQQVESEKVIEHVSSWEELPEGEWLPNDENGVNWYQDKDGRYWYSTDDGFRVWND